MTNKKTPEDRTRFYEKFADDIKQCDLRKYLDDPEDYECYQHDEGCTACHFNRIARAKENKESD